MFYQGLEQLIWSRYLSKVCIKACFWIRYFIMIIPFQKKLGDFLGICSKICASQVHYQIGNKTDGFHFWCIPNWEERGMWKIFQVEIEQISRFDFWANITICLLSKFLDHCLGMNWNTLQLYMMAIVVVMPTIMMTFAYTAISRAVSLSILS